MLLRLGSMNTWFDVPWLGKWDPCWLLMHVNPNVRFAAFPIIFGFCRKSPKIPTRPFCLPTAPHHLPCPPKKRQIEFVTLGLQLLSREFPGNSESPALLLFSFFGKKSATQLPLALHLPCFSCKSTLQLFLASGPLLGTVFLPGRPEFFQPVFGTWKHPPLAARSPTGSPSTDSQTGSAKHPPEQPAYRMIRSSPPPFEPYAKGTKPCLETLLPAKQSLP